MFQKPPQTLLDRLISFTPVERETALRELRELSADLFARLIQQYKSRSSRLGWLTALQVFAFLPLFWLFPCVEGNSTEYLWVFAAVGMLASSAYLAFRRRRLIT